MNVQKDNEDIRLARYEFDAEEVSCDRDVNFFVSLENLGSKDSDDIVFTAYNKDLEIDI